MKTKILVVAAIALIAAGAAAAARDVTWLAKRATHHVVADPQFRKAILVGAEGTPATKRPVTKAPDIVKWTFTFNNTGTGDKYKSASVTAVRGRFGKVTGGTDYLVGEARISPVPTMTLAGAIKLLRAAGFTHGFYDVTMSRPVVPHAHTVYTFQFAHYKYVNVDTVTRKVR